LATTYAEQWEVPSNSNPANSYKVSLTESGEYQCSCMGWTRHMPRRDCSHILQVKANPERYAKGAPKVTTKLTLANVDEVTKHSDDELYIPLIPLSGAPGIAATVMYDLLKYGIPWGIVKDRWGKFLQRADGGLARQDILDYVAANGRMIVDREKSSFMNTAYKVVWDGRTI
jgi:hypothetical protein